MLERMILEAFPENGNEIVNSLHFADDTTIIALSMVDLNRLLEIVARWADLYHLEVHPGKSVFYTNDRTAGLPVYKGNFIERSGTLETVGIRLDMDARTSANVDFRLNRFEQKIGIWGAQLKKCTNLNVREKVEIVVAAVLPSALYGLEFS